MTRATPEMATPSTNFAPHRLRVLKPRLYLQATTAPLGETKFIFGERVKNQEGYSLYLHCTEDTAQFPFLKLGTEPIVGSYLTMMRSRKISN
ncbi:hypothetical protein AVEN_192011-1 [Araneus ventricosus]|uniref:Uncharacterized protein n=1 Tax=Araneus ventricosus TaxID=182803 RepID=A0A4Y2B920_ARAVE|nr:hypothetical protein AVEN_192011-1 [Araneus ventricosus]